MVYSMGDSQRRLKVRSYPDCGWHHSICSGPDTIKGFGKEEVSWASAFTLLPDLPRKKKKTVLVLPGSTTILDYIPLKPWPKVNPSFLKLLSVGNFRQSAVKAARQKTYCWSPLSCNICLLTPTLQWDRVCYGLFLSAKVHLWTPL